MFRHCSCIVWVKTRCNIWIHPFIPVLNWLNKHFLSRRYIWVSVSCFSTCLCPCSRETVCTTSCAGSAHIYRSGHSCTHAGTHRTHDTIQNIIIIGVPTSPGKPTLKCREESWNLSGMCLNVPETFSPLDFFIKLWLWALVCFVLETQRTYNTSHYMSLHKFNKDKCVSFEPLRPL